MAESINEEGETQKKFRKIVHVPYVKKREI